MNFITHNNILNMDLTLKDILDFFNIDTISNFTPKYTYTIDDFTEDIYNDICLYNLDFSIKYPSYFDLIEDMDKYIKNKRKVKKEPNNAVKIDFNYDLTSGKFTNYIFHVGGTGSGKTYNAIESFMKGKGKCIYLAPLRLLAREIYDKLHSNNMTCNLITGEEKIIECQTHTSATIETVDLDKEYDIVVIDEAFMVNNKDRGKNWTNTILNIKANEAHIITNEETLSLLLELLSVDDRKYIINRYERKIPIEFTDTITSNYPSKSLLVSFSRKDVLNAYMVFDNASILYGNLPPEIKIEQMEMFNKGETDICVCTDVIGMGLNLPCEYVIFDDIFKYDGNLTRELNSSEIKQIGGRAGRYGLSDKGFITSTSPIMLDYIKTMYEKNILIKYGYIGMNEEIYEKLSKITNNIAELFDTFSTLDIIPNQYKKYLKLEPIDKYIYLYNLNKNIDKLDFKTQYKLLSLPICEYSEDYYVNIVNNIINNELITYSLNEELNSIDEILNNNYLMLIEKEIKVIELYHYLFHHFYDFLDQRKFNNTTILRAKYVNLISEYFKKGEL